PAPGRRQRPARAGGGANGRPGPFRGADYATWAALPMKFGIAIFATDKSIGVAELAREVEERGFQTLWVPEHTHIPTSRRSPWPGGPELPEHYKRTLDPFVSVTVAAVSTTRLRLGFGIVLVVERDPIVTAKEVASVDLVSGGRIVFG